MIPYPVFFVKLFLEFFYFFRNFNFFKKSSKKACQMFWSSI